MKRVYVVVSLAGLPLLIASTWRGLSWRKTLDARWRCPMHTHAYTVIPTPLELLVEGCGMTAVFASESVVYLSTKHEFPATHT